MVATWLVEEDELLVQAVQLHPDNWGMVARIMHPRGAQQCMNRFTCNFSSTPTPMSHGEGQVVMNFFQKYAPWNPNVKQAFAEIAPCVPLRGFQICLDHYKKMESLQMAKSNVAPPLHLPLSAPLARPLSLPPPPPQQMLGVNQLLAVDPNQQQQHQQASLQICPPPTQARERERDIGKMSIDNLNILNSDYFQVNNSNNHSSANSHSLLKIETAPQLLVPAHPTPNLSSTTTSLDCDLDSLYDEDDDSPLKRSFTVLKKSDFIEIKEKTRQEKNKDEKAKTLLFSSVSKIATAPLPKAAAKANAAATGEQVSKRGAQKTKLN